jgi:hypothetical protein
MKYICTKDENDKLEIFTFPRSIDHDAMAEALEGFRNKTYGNWERIYRKPISAGFVDVNGNCYDRSESLGLDSRKKEDTLLLKNQLNGVI